MPEYVFGASIDDDWYRLGYKSAHEVAIRSGNDALFLNGEDMIPLPFKSSSDPNKIAMWREGWADGIGDGLTHHAEKCVCYPGMCPRECEPACPVC